ncbi:MAG: tetratricopeptide (TPR) repeat protein [Patiriisocius sp.]|jgi:tetratricopeptide (TPR) repeat protein
MAKYNSMIRIAFVLFCFSIFTFKAFSSGTSDIGKKISALMEQEFYDSAIVVVNEHILGIEQMSLKVQANGYLVRGNAYYNLDDYNKAKVDYKRSMELSKGDPVASYKARSRLVMVYQTVYQYDSMKVHLDELMANESLSDSFSRLENYYCMYTYYDRGRIRTLYWIIF